VETFKECEKVVRHVWQEIRQNHSLSKFDAINNRYDVLGSVHEVQLRFLTPPTVLTSQYSDWFYGNRMQLA
jgi:hypothetical protein